MHMDNELLRHVLRTRWLNVAAGMKEEDIGAILLTDPADVRWLTGYSGTNGAALAVTNGPPLLATDARYTEQAARQCPDVEVIVTRDLVEQLLLRLRENGAASLAVDPTSLTLAQFRVIAAHPALFGVKLMEVNTPLAGVRMTKDRQELETMREAARISVSALQSVIDSIAAGDTELAIARRLELAMEECGADDRAFPTIVAAGENGGSPHHEPTDRPLVPGDLITIDFGAMVDGYRSDCTRTVIFGADPQDWQNQIYLVVEQAALMARTACAPGVPTAAVDAAARQHISEAGFGEFFVHGIGHGIGLNIHEAPMFGASTTGTLGKAIPFTVEPGIYLPERGGVRIEDTCVLGEDGLEILTEFPRELIRVG
jgi:Xaa-Pro aminopeptidase